MTASHMIRECTAGVCVSIETLRCDLVPNTHTHTVLSLSFYKLNTHTLCTCTTDSYINLQRTTRSILILLVMSGQPIKKLLDGYNYCLVGHNTQTHTLFLVTKSNPQ